jgi:diaminopimelate decarboxylase
MKAWLPRLHLFPLTATVSKEGHLIVGGCDTVELAATYGTPLYIFDEITLRSKCLEFRSEFSRRYPATFIIYACKAFISPALSSILKEEGLGLDVVSRLPSLRRACTSMVIIRPGKNWKEPWKGR